MAYLLFFLSIGSITALVLAIRQLQQRKTENRLLQQQTQESDRRLQDIEQKYSGVISREEASKTENRLLQQQMKESDRRLQDIEQKYGGIISREEAIRTLDTQIAALTEKSRRFSRQSKAEEYELSTKITGLTIKLQELEAGLFHSK